MSNSPKRVLITQDRLESGALTSQLMKSGFDTVNLPLDIYFAVSEKESSYSIQEELQKVQTIVFGNKMSARFFMQLFGKELVLEKLRKKINLALTQEIALFLESFDIPAISAHPKTKPIDLIELMLRLHLLGPCLYPCGRHLSEELPGFFIELDIPCVEIPVYDRRGPNQDELADYRLNLEQNPPGYVIFHNLDSVRRTKIAFPGLNYEQINVISLHETISRHLMKNDISVDLEWDGKDTELLNHLRG